jgi:hypothetical protein
MMEFRSRDRCELRVLTVHGPAGVDAGAVLKASFITLTSDDVLTVAEHDDARLSWLEEERLPVFAWGCTLPPVPVFA